MLRQSVDTEPENRTVETIKSHDQNYKHSLTLGLARPDPALRGGHVGARSDHHVATSHSKALDNPTKTNPRDDGEEMKSLQKMVPICLAGTPTCKL